MTTALVLVQDAMYTAGVLGQDGTSQPEAAADQQLALRFLQRMLDSWANESLLLYTTSQETLPMVANTATYSTALLSTPTRPVSVDGMYVLYAGVSYPIEMIGRDAYNQIGIKTVAAIPQYCYYNPDMTQGSFTFFPVPYATMTAFVDCERVLTGTLTLATDVVLPPGYEEAIVASLAEAICRPFGRPLTPDIARAAKEARARIKKRNVEFVELATPFGADTSYDLSYICYPW